MLLTNHYTPIIISALLLILASAASAAYWQTRKGLHRLIAATTWLNGSTWFVPRFSPQADQVPEPRIRLY